MTSHKYPMRYIDIVEDRRPALFPSIRVNGKVYTSKHQGANHFDALALITDENERRRATLDGNKRGFTTERGRWLRRDQAAKYARDNDLYDDGAENWAKWMRDSYELSSETPLKKDTA